MKRNFLFLFLLGFLLFIMIKFGPIVGYSSEPSVFSGGGSYFIKTVLTSGHLIPLENAQLLSTNVFAGGIKEYARYPLYPALYAVTLLITGVKISSWNENILKSIIFALPISFVILAIYLTISKKVEKKPDLKLAFLIFLYSLMASPFIITQQGANGTLFILFTVYLVFIRNSGQWNVKLLSIIFLLLLPASYFTGSSFFLLWLSISLLLVLITKNFNFKFMEKLISKRKYNIELNTVFLLLVIVYFSYSIYISFDRLAPTFSVFINLYDIIMSGFTGFTTASPLLPSDYIVETSLESKLRNFVNGFLVALSLLIFLFLFIKQKFENKLKDTSLLLISGIIALPCLTILIYFWLGQLGLARLQEYGSVVSIITVASIAPVLMGNGKKILSLILILAIISSAFTYIFDESIPYRYISNQEEYGANWMSDDIANQSSIFTDQRLSGKLISNGHLNVKGVLEYSNNVTDLLNALYYSNDENQLNKAISDYKPKFLYFSSAMTQNAPAIMLYNYPVKPAPTNFLDKYNSNQDFNKLYDNGQSFVYNNIRF